MPRYLILFAALLVPTHAVASAPVSAEGSIKVTGYVPASCRVVTDPSGTSAAWACNSQAPATVTKIDTADSGGASVSRLTIRPTV